MEKERFIIIRNVLLVLMVTSGAVWVGLGCTSRPCREPRLPELDQTKKAPAPATAPGAAALAPETAATGGLQVPPLPVPTRIRVFKPDGSLQCEKRGGQAVDAMERELAGVKIYAREKRKDGLMHIQVCGSPSGMINLYEIDSANLKRAEERGFKRFED